MPSSPPRRWDDLRSLGPVGVWGLGIEGRASLDRLADLGIAPAVLVDDAPTGSGVIATHGGGFERLQECAIVVKSPGISRYSTEVRALEAEGVEVVGGLGLWLEEHGSTGVIGVTGTKGKSTTTSIAAHLARSLGVRAAAGGNIGLAPWSPSAPDVDLWIIEVSSYQATDLWSSPQVCAVTSLHEDHLTWHGDSPQNYFRDKLSLCRRPGHVVTIANGDDARLTQLAPLLGEPVRWVTPGDAVDSWTSALHLRGRHNQLNAQIAAACLVETHVDGATDDDRLRAASKGYEPLPHRLETLAIIDGIEYVDDSLSTNVLPTIAAAEVFEGQRLALLAGGLDRGIDYTPLAEFVATRHAPTLVVALPTNGTRIAAAVEHTGGTAVMSVGLRDAIQHATSWLAGEGVVLLSPAAASFDLYESYLGRSKEFAALVEELRAHANA